MKREAQSDTVQFYNENASKYFSTTVTIDMSKDHQKFLGYLAPGANILDVGCGSGRDSKAFLDLGFKVVAMDASEEMVRLAEKHINQPVFHRTFSEIDEEDVYEGIWASATLLHIPSDELLPVMKKLKKALKKGGVWYMSFKYGQFEGDIENRYFHYLTEEKLKEYIFQMEGFNILNLDVFESYQPHRNQKWVRALIQKI